MNWLNGNTILYCRHWQQTQHFYLQQLGFQEKFRREDWFVEMQVAPGCHLSLADAEHCSIVPGEGRGLTLSFQCQGLLSTHQALRSQGLDCTDIHDRSWREPYFYVRDPEGNRIEIWSPRSRQT